MHSYDVFSHYERLHWRLTDLDFGSIDPAAVRPEYVTLAKSATMGESNVSTPPCNGFLNEFVDDYDFSTFAVVWGYQEVQHHYAFRVGGWRRSASGWTTGRSAPCASRTLPAPRRPPRWPPTSSPSSRSTTSTGGWRTG